MLKQIRTIRQDEGFTLIELLMVIVILGILAGIAVFAVSGITDTGAEAACKADYKTVQVASEAYYTQNGDYAADIAELISGGFLRSEPGTGGDGAGDSYTITYSGTDGTVAASGACTLAAG
jgi:prepilin-type N-terminal cleavage/methylation domain-containing protein